MVQFSIQNVIWKYSETKFLPMRSRDRLCDHVIAHDIYKSTNLQIFRFYFFLYEFCFEDISKTEATIMFKFSQYLCPDQEWIL